VDPELRPARAKRDQKRRLEIQRVWDENLAVYGAEKVWRQLIREGFESWPPCSGSIGSITGGCSRPSATSHLLNSRKPTIAVRTPQPWWLDSCK